MDINSQKIRSGQTFVNCREKCLIKLQKSYHFICGLEQQPRSINAIVFWRMRLYCDFFFPIANLWFVFFQWPFIACEFNCLLRSYFGFHGLARPSPPCSQVMNFKTALTKDQTRPSGLARSGFDLVGSWASLCVLVSPSEEWNWSHSRWSRWEPSSAVLGPSCPLTTFPPPSQHDPFLVPWNLASTQHCGPGDSWLPSCSSQIIAEAYIHLRTMCGICVCARVCASSTSVCVVRR